MQLHQNLFKKIWIICLFIIFYIISVDSMQCYSCESVYNDECGENFVPLDFFKLDCSRVAPPRYMDLDLENKNATACMKLIYKDKDTSKIIRNCYFGEINDTSVGCRMDPTLLDISNEQCHVCENDFCNASQKMSKENQIFIIFLGFLFSFFCTSTS